MNRHATDSLWLDQPAAATARKPRPCAKPVCKLSLPVVFIERTVIIGADWCVEVFDGVVKVEVRS